MVSFLAASFGAWASFLGLAPNFRWFGWFLSGCLEKSTMLLYLNPCKK
jgi:hypothetical protein